MKTITLRIPTSLAELKQMRKERLNKRYKKNVQVLRDAIDGIIAIANSGYWRGDISDTFRERVFHSAPYSQQINEIYKTAKSKLK